jgi:hypothetical protein
MVEINEFIDRLATETPMSRADCADTVKTIMNFGNLNDAMDIYDKYGIDGLSNYIFEIVTMGREEVL